MALVDLLIWIILSIIIGSFVGIVTAKLSLFYMKKQDGKKRLKVIKGELSNNLKLDGETINVDKFTYKENSGKMFNKVTFADIVEKTSQKPLGDENKDITKKFWKKNKK